MFPNLLHFVDSCLIYMKENGILFNWAKTHTNEVLKVGIKKNQINNHEPYCALKAMKQHVWSKSIK
jgi:hypothetical protein